MASPRSSDCDVLVRPSAPAVISVFYIVERRLDKSKARGIASISAHSQAALGANREGGRRPAPARTPGSPRPCPSVRGRRRKERNHAHAERHRHRHPPLRRGRVPRGRGRPDIREPGRLHGRCRLRGRGRGAEGTRAVRWRAATVGLRPVVADAFLLFARASSSRPPTSSRAGTTRSCRCSRDGTGLFDRGVARSRHVDAMSGRRTRRGRRPASRGAARCSTPCNTLPSASKTTAADAARADVDDEDAPYGHRERLRRHCAGRACRG